MNTASTHFILRSISNKSNSSTIYLRVTCQRRSSYLSTGIKINPSDWHNEKERVRRSHSNYQSINKSLDELDIKVQKFCLEFPNQDKLTAKAVTNFLKGYSKKNFFDYAEDYIDQLTSQGSRRLAKQTRVIVNKIHDFSERRTLQLHQIDERFLNELQEFLDSKYDNAINTIRKDFTRLRRLFERAKKESFVKHSPFESYDMPSRQSSTKEALTIQQIEAIEDLDLEAESLIWHVRNYFMFSFYNAGIRFGDLCKLKRENIVDGRLKYLMSKTKSNSNPKWKNIKLLPPSLDILELYNYQDKSPDDFLFPIVNDDKDLSDPVVFDKEKQSKNALVNKYLKKIAERAGIEISLSTHIARHSFANYARKQGMSMYSISKALAHSDLKTTQQYLSGFDEQMLDKEMNSLFD